MRPSGLWIFASLLLSAVCLAAPPASPSSILIEGVPHVLQKPDFCGEACVEMWAGKLGAGISQDDVFDASGLDPALGRGCYTKELLAALKALGFDSGPDGSAFHKIRPDKDAADLGACLSSLIDNLRKGVPSILCMRYGVNPGAPEHFRLVVGYDPKSDSIIYMEPAEKGESPRRMEVSTLFDLWPLKYSQDEWTAVMIPLAVSSGGLKPPGRHASGTFTGADYAQHIRKLRASFKSPMSVIVERPFVVVGDLERTNLERYSKGTVRWAVDKLKASYFTRDPERILTIWLLSGPASYKACAKRLTGEEPDTPYGFFSSSCDSLVMDISTGGGTLVHEIVHPFIEANFPLCPSWFNEGLGSLYEQCGERDGQIIGLTNWRLAGLQKAVAADALPDFKTLTGYSREQFYGDNSGRNYAQARYLCHYLQERGLLVKFYKTFRRDCARDPTGYASLLSVLNLQDKDMPKFKADWQDYVMKLRFN